MRCYIEFIFVPTADTPGTLLYLHFDDRRYLIGRVAEGSTRACAERGIALRKVSDIILTGKTEWDNVGGLLGMILNLADSKVAARASADASDGGRSKQSKAQDNELNRINIYGAPNLNHLFATSRRFIFRTGMPLNVNEFSAEDMRRTPEADIKPTWKDSRIVVWAMPVLPSPTSPTRGGSSRKRVFEEATDEPSSNTSDIHNTSQNSEELRKSIVRQMFDSSWRYDRLVPQSLSNVQSSTACFLRDPETNRLTQYDGPMPGGNQPAPDITVLAREPWPGAATRHVPPTQVAQEAMCYIIRNHPQRGRFMPQKAKELNVPKGFEWRRLASGESVLNSKGETITPDMVLQPGKEGGGVAIVDLPSVEYLEPLLSRPEWQSQEIMKGVEAIVWILGPGMLHDARLQDFQRNRSHMKHVVSSPDCCPNVVALERAATSALRHNLVDHEIFPALEWNSVVSEPIQARIARAGQVLSLEPKVDYEDDRIMAPFDPESVRSKLSQDIQASEEIAGALTSASQMLESSGPPLDPHGDVEIIVLGTGSSHPSTYRNVSGTLVRVPGWGSCLFDCGEGSLNTMRRMFSTSELQKILVDLKMIWISHMHADHHLGLTSVIKAWNGATKDINPHQKLAVVSDAPMLHWLHEYSSVEELGMSRILPFATSPLSGLSRDVENVQLLEKQVTSLRFIHPRSSSEEDSRATDDILQQLGIASLNTVYVNHCRGAQAISIVFNSGFKISYSGDCRPDPNFTLIGRGSHVLIHEATLEDDMRAEAIAKKHSTAGEALVVASEMQAQVCLLTHFSQRYPTMPPLGVKVGVEISQARLQSLGGVLEENKPGFQDGPDAGIDAMPKDGDPDSDESPTAADGQSKPKRTSSRKGLQVLGEYDLQRLIEQNGLKVLFAFDYMRLKLKNIHRLEVKQPILRRIYELEIGKDVMKPTEDEGSEETRLDGRDKKGRDKGNKVKAKSESGDAQSKNGVASDTTTA